MTAPSTLEASVVIPTLNEEQNVREMAGAVAEALRAADVSSYEIIFIDNGSTDRTVPLVKELCAADPRVKLIVNTRNFGQMRSPTHGIYQARGRAILSLCADFQDPPALLTDFLRMWRAGAKIVLGVRETERASPWLRLGRLLGYGFLHRFGDYPVIPGATGFGLYDRAVVDTLSAWNEPEPFFRGMLVESGYTVATVPYHRAVREKGRSKNNLATLLSFALSGLASSSKKLLRLPLVLAAGVAVGAVAALAAVVPALVVGGPWLALLGAGAIALGFALVFLFLGLLGEQVRLISE